MEMPYLIQELTKEMEDSFKRKGLHEQLNELVRKGISLSDDEVKRALAVMKSPLVVVSGSVANVFNLRDKNEDILERIEASRLQEEIDFAPNAAYKGKVKMSMWRRIVELEALNREIADVDLSKVLSAISKKVSKLVIENVPIEAEANPELTPTPTPTPTPAKEPSAVKVDVPVNGYTAKNAPPELWKKVVSLRDQGMPFHQIEKELGLRQVRGMTAHRIYNKASKARK